MRRDGRGGLARTSMDGGRALPSAGRQGTSSTQKVQKASRGKLGKCGPLGGKAEVDAGAEQLVLLAIRTTAAVVVQTAGRVIFSLTQHVYLQRFVRLFHMIVSIYSVCRRGGAAVS